MAEDMTALIADTTDRDTAKALAKLRVARVPRPEPKPGQVLVKMAAAPCNPADFYYLEGRYGIDRPLPATPGFEGAGEVVASGGGMLGRWLVGKRVACGGHECTGTWAEYVVTASDQCLPLRKELSFDQGATAVANPMTALSLVGLAEKGGHRAYINTGAAGQLGKMIRAIGDERGLVGIHVVRRKEHVTALGADHVLDSSAPEFAAQLATKCRELGATIAFDAVAGAMTGALANALCEGGEVVIYGALEGKPSGSIDPMELCFRHKQVRGFELAGHLKALGMLRSMRLGTAAQKLVARGLAATQVRDRVPLAEAPARLAEYASAMSDGKMLLVP